MEQILNYIKVNNKISTSGQPSAEEFNQIKEQGFEVVINLALHNASNAIQEEDKVVTNLGMSYFHIPVNFENPRREEALLFLKTMQALSDNKIWVHCAMNYRVTAFMYTYHKHILNTPFEDINLSIFEQWSPSLSWQNIMKEDFTEIL